MKRIACRSAYIAGVGCILTALWVDLGDRRPCRAGGDESIAADTKVASAIRLLEASIQSQISYEGIPSVSIGIVYEQRLVWSRGFGYTDLVARTVASPTSLYRIASMTKPFTATAIMQLRDEGKLRLEDSLVSHLPWFAIRSEYTDSAPITIWQVLTHTAGLPRESVGPYWADQNLPSRDQMLAALPSQQIILRPGTHFKYSNLGYAVLGEVITTLAHESYAGYLDHHILKPLGMTDTYVDSDPEVRRRVAVGYGRRLPGQAARSPIPFTDSRALAPAATLTSTVVDLARFTSLQFESADVPVPNPVLKPASIEEMQRVQWMESDWSTAWGLGFGVWRRNGRTIVGHGGGIGGYSSQLLLCPEDKIGVIVLTNADDGRAGSLANEAFDWVGPAILDAAARRRPTPILPTSDWNAYVGVYRSEWNDLQVVELNGQLAIIDPTSEEPASQMYRLTPAGNHTFHQSLVGGRGGELIIFEPGPSGKARGFRQGANYYERVGP